MGTTTTTNLSLIKPDVNESIKEVLPTFAGWAAQNAINMDKIDALFRNTNANYVPTPAWTATGSNPTLGSGGFVEGKALRLWPRLVIGHIRILTGGAGFATGSGTYGLNLPFAAPAEFATLFDSAPVGKMVAYDADSVVNSTTMNIYLGKTGSLYCRPPTGGSWTDTVPFTVAQNDRFSGYFMYPTADA